ncbi:MAG: cytochrome b/b6 domain-containing protein [Betaproteobacteria bacterium]|nr:MAG: cytochrome b/b6 domain-containing protein [Betaproteobacteria bacterium]
MSQQTPAKQTVRVWDLPVRVFHWVLVLLVVSQIVTVSIGGNAMEYHVLGGYAILALVVFRILWGLLGTPTARFSNFVRGPVAVLRYARSLASAQPEKVIGHNPLGGWSVVAMLVSLLVQAVSGLFADDEIMTTGPLWKYVSEDTASMFNVIHETNALVLLTLICIHLAAILFYLLRKKENLIKPMFTGSKQLSDSNGESLRPFQGTLRALVVLAICAVATWVVVSL